MYKFYFIVAVIVFIGVIEIQGDHVNAAPNGVLLTPEDGCGHSKVQHKRIVGGSPAKNGAWPWMALLGYRNGTSFKFKCGGTLISTKHILSAAHCIKPELYFARLGEYDTKDENDGPHEDIEISSSVSHEEFDDPLKINDIALIHLVRDVVFKDRIQPICLPLKKDIQQRTFVANNAFVAGWGVLHSPKKHSKGQLSTVLMETQVPVIENEECKEDYRRIGKLLADAQFDNGVMCAGFREGGSSSCLGDSGGPLMLPIFENGKFPFYQIGIVSHGVGCGRPNVPAVYVNIAYYIDWIEKKIRG